MFNNVHRKPKSRQVRRKINHSGVVKGLLLKETWLYSDYRPFKYQFREWDPNNATFRKGSQTNNNGFVCLPPAVPWGLHKH